jgi:hypothetical protein
MSLWTLLAFGLVGFFTVSVLVGLSVAAILGQVSRELSSLLDPEVGQRTATLAMLPSSTPAAGRRKLSTPAA